MKHFLDLTGLTQFLAKLRQTFVGNIKTDNAAENAASGTITFEKKDSTGAVVETTVAVKNVVTTDTAQDISGNKNFTGTVTAQTPTADSHVATKAYVDEATVLAEAMTYKGTLGEGGTITSLPLETTGTGKNKTPVTGDTYKVITAGDYIPATGQTQSARVGDLFIAKVASGTGTQAVTWDYIPSGDETETFVAITDGDTAQGHHAVNVNDTPGSGDIYFGMAAARQVDTSIGSGTTSINLPTSEAVANYALSSVTAGNGITIGTKSLGEQSVAVKVKANSGITSDSDGIYANVDSNSGLSINSSTGAIELTTPGDGIEVDSTTHNITAKANTKQGIEVTPNGIGIALYMGSNGAGGNINISGLEFDTDGKLQVNAGNGITVDENGVAVNVDSTNANGLSVGANGLAMAKGSTSTLGTVKVTNGNGLNIDNTGTISMATAVASTSGEGGSNGAMLATDKEKLDNLASSTIVGKNGITVTKTGNETDITADIDTDAGLTFTGDAEGSKQIGVNAGNGLTFDSSTGKLQVQANSTNSGLAVDSNGVRVVAGSGLAVDSSGVIVLAGSGLAVNGCGIKVKIIKDNSASQTLSFDANGNLGIVSITDTEIDNLFNPQQAG